jgi:hypothetical protein
MKISRFFCAVTALALVSACAPQVPDSARGVGFDSIQAVEARDAALQGARFPDTILPPAGGTGAPEPLTGVGPLPGSAEETAAATTRILAETRPQAPAAASSVSTSAATNSIGLSNENNFDAVSEQRSIESDAARIAQNRAEYQVIAPQALPERVDGDQPNIVAFALSTDHPVGTRVYARAGLNGASRAERNCRDYASPDQAQIDFLARGGPVRDRKGLDPDGDGYACSWDPSPFRKAGRG